MILELSARNPRVADVRRLLRQRAQRRRMSRFVVETPKLVVEALDSDLGVDHVIVPADQHPDPDIAERCDALGVRMFSVDAEVFTKLADSRTPQPALAVVEAPSLDFDHRFDTPEGESTLILALVDVADPGNVGTLLRTAEATGCRGVVVAGSTADVLSPKVVRSSAGSVLRVPIGELDPNGLVDALRSRVARVVATAVDAAPYDRLEPAGGPTVFVLGSEAHGLPDEIAAGADAAVSIPMQGMVESLNVATAGSVLAFDHARRERAS